MALIDAPEHPPFAYERRKYVRAPNPIHFPSEESPEEAVGETKRHLEARTTLYLLLKDAFAGAAIGSDQFVYWDAKDPRKCLSPDVFVKRGVPNDSFDNWKIWQRSAPDLAVEIVSASDRRDDDWDEKLDRYQASGIREVVRFDPANQKHPVRVWDRIDEDLVERVPDSSHHRECVALGLWWVVVPSEDGPMLRLARDREGTQLLPTPNEEKMRLAEELAEERKARSLEEHKRMLAEHARALSDQARLVVEEKLREEVEARAREREEAAAEIERLKAELARLRGERP
jgi:hypothetical protein